jgi:hypothetical protein
MGWGGGLSLLGFRCLLLLLWRGFSCEVEVQKFGGVRVRPILGLQGASADEAGMWV